MAFSFVNFSGGGQAGGPFTSATTATQSVTSGNALVVASRWPVASITDTAGNHYIPLPFLVNTVFGNLGEGVSWFYCNNCIGKSNLQVTVNLGPTSAALNTYTYVGCWQFSGATLAFDSHQSGQSGGASTTQSFTLNPHYQQSLICAITIVNSLSTFTVSGGLTQDGGTSIAGNQIAGAEHQIFSPATQQTLTTHSSASAAWFIGGPVFQTIPPQISPAQRNRLVAETAAPPMFTGRLYDYWITLEKLWPLS